MTSTSARAGSFMKMIVGHDRFIADVRPQLYRILRQPLGLSLPPIRLLHRADRRRSGRTIN